MDMSFSLKNKNAIIVGGSGDLGKSIAKGYLKKGAKVVVLDIDNGIEDFVKELNPDMETFKFIRIDLSDDDEIESRFKDALNFLNGPLHILVNSAGIQIRHQSNELTRI